MTIKSFMLIFILTLSACDSTSPNELSGGKKTKAKSKLAQHEKNSTENQKYLQSREKLEPYAFTSEVKRINDPKIKLPIDREKKYGAISTDYALLDFNKDGFDDLFFEYYGLSGTGEKNVIDIYFFEPGQNKYTETSLTLVNPSYFFTQNIITSYYFGLGGGSATKYQIANGKLEIIETIDINIDYSEEFQTTFRYTQSPFSDTLEYQDNMVRLPPEYRYRKIIQAAKTL